jgi:hypothetical protein
MEEQQEQEQREFHNGTARRRGARNADFEKNWESNSQNLKK